MSRRQLCGKMIVMTISDPLIYFFLCIKIFCAFFYRKGTNINKRRIIIRLGAPERYFTICNHLMILAC